MMFVFGVLFQCLVSVFGVCVWCQCLVVGGGGLGGYIGIVLGI